ncbi:MAG: DEAD/DEAH box helicase [Candidatus Hodarchaeales archaeon]|jgi:helicase
MLIDSLALDNRIKTAIIEHDGIKELYPPQTEAIKQGLLTGKNFVISIPTAAGKTLLAEIAALKHILEQGGKVIYLCPLRALASEKYQELKRFSSLGVRVAITSGDFDSQDSYLSHYDIIVSTNEKMDALLRHQTRWVMEKVSLIIIDECHLINDKHRGPTLETLLARLLIENSRSQIIALSATVGNADELAEWLNAELVQSDWRPVPLKEGVYFEDKVTYPDYTTREIPFKRKDPLVNIALDSIHSQEQVLIFVPSRRSAVSTAERIGKAIEPYLNPKENKRLNEISSQAIRNLSDPLSSKLAQTIKQGVTFHHAGLNSQQRELVETAFKNRFIKILCATPTLASGINLPAKRVVVSSVYRYSIQEGSHPIKTLEYKQMSGRAGRPQFDSEGEAILLAKQARVVGWLMDRYILRDSEAIYSKLAAKPALRRNILGLIASKVVQTVSDLLHFFEKTFYGFQFEAVLLEGKIREIIDLLIGWRMIRPLDVNETLNATLYGLRVSQLYLDPETAASIAEGLTEGIQTPRSKIHSVALFDLIVGTPDMVGLSFLKKDEKRTEKLLNEIAPELIRSVPDPLDIEYDFRLRDFKTVLFLWDWINEVPPEQIIMRYGIGSGDIKRVVDAASWLVSAMTEISKLKLKENKFYGVYVKKARSLSERVIYGIKKDAISLTRAKGVGRKRARLLLDHGIRDLAQLSSTKVSEISKIPGFGIELSKSILESAIEATTSKDSKINREYTNGDISDYIF